MRRITGVTPPEPHGKCEATGKQKFGTGREAERMLTYIKRRHKGRSETSSYRCRHCHWWHLTSQRNDRF